MQYSGCMISDITIVLSIMSPGTVHVFRNILSREIAVNFSLNLRSLSFIRAAAPLVVSLGIPTGTVPHQEHCIQQT